MRNRRLNVEPRHPRTCDWILDVTDYKQWVMRSQGLLWVKGKPGAGKSTVMVFLYDHFNNQAEQRSGQVARIQLEFFYSARGTELQRTFDGMLRSLLHQLFSQDALTRPQIRAIFEGNTRSFGNSPNGWKWHLSELKALFLKAVVAAAERRPVTIFVDALDEAGEHSARQIMEYLHLLHKQVASTEAQMKICVSCRHYPIVTSRSTTYEIMVEHHNSSDIARFIDDTLCLEDVARRDPTELETWQALKPELARRAQGVFQWAHLIVPLVQKRVDKGESILGIRPKLKDVPPKLRDVYIHILKNVIDEEDRALSFWLFQWVLFAARSLTVEEVRAALTKQGSDQITTNETMKVRIKTLSGGLLESLNAPVSAQRFEDYVQVSHQSVNDFMRAEGLALLARLCGNISAILLSPANNYDSTNVHCQCHARLYQTCLDYLSSADVYGYEDWLRSKYDLRQSSPFVEYATKYLFHHAEQAGPSQTDMFSDTHAALLRVFPRWLKLHPTLFTFRHESEGSSLLHEATKANMVDTVQRLLRDSHDINVQDCRGRTAMHFAAMRGHHEIARVLVDAGATVNAPDKGEMTPLAFAVRHKQTPIAEWLLGQDTYAKATTKIDRHSLYEAAINGSTGLAKVLIGAGADVNAQGGRAGTALIAACSCGHKELVRMLLAERADVNAPGYERGTALQAASYSKNEEIVQMLLAAGADVNAPGGDQSSTALIAACQSKSEAVVRILLAAGADVNARWEPLFGTFTALERSLTFGYERIVQILLEHGATDAPPSS